MAISRQVLFCREDPAVTTQSLGPSTACNRFGAKYLRRASKPSTDLNLPRLLGFKHARARYGILMKEGGNKRYPSDYQIEEELETQTSCETTTGRITKHQDRHVVARAKKQRERYVLAFFLQRVHTSS